MGESNSKTEKNISKSDQLHSNEVACGGGRNQHKSTFNAVSNLIDYRLQGHRIEAKIMRCEKDVARIRLQKQEQNNIRDKEKQPNKIVQAEFSGSGTQVSTIPTKTKNGDVMTEQTGTMKRRSDILRNRKDIEKQLIKNLGTIEMAKLKIIYHNNKSLEGKADEGSNATFCKDNKNSFDVPIVNDRTYNNSTQAPVINQQNIHGQPPPPYSPRSVPVSEHLSVANVMPDFFASNLPASNKIYQNEMRSKQAEERQGNVFSNRKGYKHKNDGQQTKNKRKIGKMRGS